MKLQNILEFHRILKQYITHTPKQFCTQSVLKPHSKSPGTRINTGFPSSIFLLKLGKSKDILKYICLSFVSFLPLFYFCCIYYFGSLIFCCQFVARFIITGRKTFDKYCLFYILASLYALSSSLSLNILYIHSGIA